MYPFSAHRSTATAANFVNFGDGHDGRRGYRHVADEFVELLPGPAPRRRATTPAEASALRARKAGRIGGRPRLVVNRDRVAAMKAEGRSVRDIGQELGISASGRTGVLALELPPGCRTAPDSALAVALARRAAYLPLRGGHVALL